MEDDFSFCKMGESRGEHQPKTNNNSQINDNFKWDKKRKREKGPTQK